MRRLVSVPPVARGERQECHDNPALCLLAPRRPPGVVTRRAARGPEVPAMTRLFAFAEPALLAAALAVTPAREARAAKTVMRRLVLLLVALAIVSVGLPVPGASAAAPATPTTTSPTSSPNPSTLGANVTLTATVMPATTAGSVQFFDGSTPLGAPVAVSSGTASLSIDTLGLGSHSLTARFSPIDPSSFTG